MAQGRILETANFHAELCSGAAGIADAALFCRPVAVGEGVVPWYIVRTVEKPWSS